MRSTRLLLACTTLSVLALPVRGSVVPIAVGPTGCELVLETGRPDDCCYLVIGSLADATTTTQVTVQTKPTDAPPHVPPDRTVVSPVWRELIREQAARQEQARRQQRPANFAQAASPASSRVFHIFVKERELLNPAHYAAVVADLRAVGRHCQVYVDRDVRGQAGLEALLDDIRQTFDGEIFPWASRHLGTVQDVDRDGRFTILLTPLLGQLQNGKVGVDGFVRGSDFDRDRGAPFSNRCDMLYLNSQLRPGPHLRTVLAHEYTHAVLYCEHVLERYLPNAAHEDEESWLNEGLAHLIEEHFHYSWSNLGQRLRTYWSAPERYPLAVADHFSSGMWRNPGVRGACFLFLRSCRERHGDCLLTRLSRSSLHGVPNLEAATGERFDECFRHWGITQLLHAAEWARQAKLDRLCVGPRQHDLRLDGSRQRVALAGTALLYLRLHSPVAARTRVLIHGTALQVTLVTPARRSAWLEAQGQPEAGTLKLRLRAHHGDVRLEAAAWQRQLAVNSADETGPLPLGAVAWLKAGDGWTTAACQLPASVRGAECVVQVLGRDRAGQTVTAWAGRPAAPVVAERR